MAPVSRRSRDSGRWQIIKTGMGSRHMKKLLLIVAIGLTCALTGMPCASGQSAQFVYSNFSGNPTPGSSFSFDITLNFTVGGSVANLNGLSYWMYEVTSPGGGSNLAITLRGVTGSLFTDLQSTSLTYPQNLNPINRNANGTQNNTDLGALSSNSLPSGSYFIAHITIAISANALPGMYTIGNTTVATPGVGGRISVITDDQGTTFPIMASNFSFEIPEPSTTPTPINISGTISYCSNPVPGPVPNVTLTLTGGASGSTLSDGSGNYTLSSLPSGGSYTVTPTKAARTPGSAGINAVDVLAVQRHFLNIAHLSGCRLTAADVNGDSVINAVDVIAIQRFFLGITTGTANVGKYKFTPANRTYTGIVSNQTGSELRHAGLRRRCFSVCRPCGWPAKY